ncbi:MAG TPA: protein kinase [Thermoanaerobaculia bacterium]|nr:protein kinase [Thermoanaerobaculia bacterium]
MEAGRIGPYRLERQIGSGGMGVVYAAWDERLERRVALKKIRPDAAGAPLQRDRFRREARAVARLNHPAIVQIHDLLETPDGDWIVLEHVEGTSLARRLRQGPLRPDEVVSLARDILGALEEAHTHGFLHRDLKSENVMLTPSGRAKVLDFGLAKLFEKASPEESTHLTDGIVGTYRAMSPEQANGLPLGPRSDLFSLGVLLYEAATGTSPFQADTPVEILTRVCTHQPEPVHERRPEIPQPLSRWIDALLEKDPERRPRSAREAAASLASLDLPEPPSAMAERFRSNLEETTVEAGLTARGPVSASSVSPYRSLPRPRQRLAWAAAALLGAAGIAIAWRTLSVREPLYVVAARPEIGAAAGREEVVLAASAWNAAVLRVLSSLEGVAVLAPEAPEAGEPSPSAQQLAHRLAADEILTSSLECQARQCLGVLRRLRGSDGSLLDIQSFEVPLSDLHLLETAVTAYLKRGYDGFRSRPGSPALKVSDADYRRFLLLLRKWETERSSTLDPLLADLKQIRASSPLFLDAYVLEARVLDRRFFETRNEADLTRALGLIEQARAFAPGDPLPLLTLFNLSLSAGRADLAAEALEEWERLMPGDVRTLRQHALLSELRGEKERALDLMRAAVERRSSVRLLMDLGSLEMRQGEIASARSTLEDLLRRDPGHLRAERLLAQLELESGSPNRAAELYLDLVRRTPGFSELSNLGLAQLLLGRYDEAAGSLQRAFHLAPQSAAAALNLADAEMLKGRRAEAETLYHRTLELAAQDPAPDFWQLLSIRAQALAHLGRAPEAASAIQRAVLAAPENPQLAYEASLVYTVIGDTASALASAERALTAGYAPRWFSLPWFDTLHKDPAFESRLSSGLSPRPREAR